MRLSETFTQLGGYPMGVVDDARAKAEALGIELIEFGIGEPHEDTPEFIRQALKDAVVAESRYPRAVGLPATRAAITGWIERRFGVTLDPDTDVIPTFGSKEAIFHLAQIVGGDTVVVTTPGYTPPLRGALFAGKDVVELALTADNDFLPDLDHVPWDRLSILWLNYPNNPTGATVGIDFLERAAALCQANDAILACDEAYSEIWFDQPPASGLQVSDLTNVIVFNTLSKRSSMPGYRIGLAAGDPELIAALKRYRPNVGLAPQEIVQHAAIAAWADETHVEAMRSVYAAKRDVMLPALQASGLRHVGGGASFFLWMQTPEPDEQERVLALVEKGIICAAGSAFGAPGAGHVRFALVPTLEQCRQAAALLAA